MNRARANRTIYSNYLLLEKNQIFYSVAFLSVLQKSCQAGTVRVNHERSGRIMSFLIRKARQLPGLVRKARQPPVKRSSSCCPRLHFPVDISSAQYHAQALKIAHTFPHPADHSQLRLFSCRTGGSTSHSL